MSNDLKVVKKVSGRAIQWLKHDDFLPKNFVKVRKTTWDEVNACVGKLAISSRCLGKYHNVTIDEIGVIDTVYGKMFVFPGDWVIQDAHGGIEICPDALFNETYYEIPSWCIQKILGKGA